LTLEASRLRCTAVQGLSNIVAFASTTLFSSAFWRSSFDGRYPRGRGPRLEPRECGNDAAARISGPARDST